MEVLELQLQTVLLPNPSTIGHATHVVGTIGASGVSASAKGMAPESSIASYNWNNDLTEVTNEINSTGLLLSNHSYGVPVLNDEGELTLQ
ncbi:S8 family serine peptidase [Flavobacterium sp.]|uniref:S8 family serine peptidase n=1 Tax=Flavobacterium sp. TaxID=239 RepID=UPI0035279DAE